MKNTVIGILAHVDAGKTTLAEAMLYLTGSIRAPGRVDRGDTHLDTGVLERERGITIFSKQTVLETGQTHISLLDTPGHVDFSSEMERTLHVLDAAVLVISGTDGVQAHTETLWELLRRYEVPVFVFVTKMDLARRERNALMDELHARLGEGCMEFSPHPDPEELAMADEALFDRFLSDHTPTDADIARLVAERRVFPCYFGSGLKLEGIGELLAGLDAFAPAAAPGGDFGAKVYKIMHDASGTRLSCLRVTSGSLRVRSGIRYMTPEGEAEEKINQLRIYSGAKYETVDEVYAGQVCVAAGLSGTFPGQGLGIEPDSPQPVLQPAMTYRLELPRGCDPALVLPKLRQLEEEDPLLHIVWNERLGETQLQLMGPVQTEVLESVIAERFGLEAHVGAGRIMYRETIAAPVEGVGHYEPLKHYAEVHLLLEPGEPGSGLVFETRCPEDELDRNWQRLVLTHLEEKQHLGVLTGSPVTDLRITLMSGRAHIKHTEGGDFRQATYRAVRQGLIKAESVLLEPYYEFRIEVPPESAGRVISDIRAMSGEFEGPDTCGEMSLLTGIAPVSEMNGYAAELASFTRGRGRFSCRMSGYRPCHDARRVIESIGYEPERDLENTPDSVFCAHGGGFTVKWSEVESYMHLESCLREEKAPPRPMRCFDIDERELEAIMQREFGPVKRPHYTAARTETAPARLSQPKKEYVIVDGYNVIFAWDELKSLAAESLDMARKRLTDILSNYRGFTKNETVLVFDAYKVAGNAGAKEEHHGVHVVYTRQGETGDAYIERLTHDIGKNYSVRVVTSDNLIRLSALRAGVLRVSAKEFRAEVDWVLGQIDEILRRSNAGSHTTKIDPRGFENGDGK
jgi:ribosomal protection tetracycline resistance protein